MASSGMHPEGDSAKRMPKGFDPGHRAAVDLKRKDFLLSVPLRHEDFGTPKLVELLTAKFQASTPYMRFLCSALGAGF